MKSKGIMKLIFGIGDQIGLVIKHLHKPSIYVRIHEHDP